MPTGDSGGGGKGNNRAALKKLVEGWTALDKLIKDNPNSPDLEGLKEDRRKLADRVVSYVEKHPKMWDAAVNMGFNGDILDNRARKDSDGDGIDDTADSKPNDPGNGDKPGDGGGGGGGGSGGGGGGSGGGGGGGGDGGGGHFLPGSKGKDYQVVRKGGEYYVVYKMKVKGKTVSAMWKIPKNNLKDYGITDGDGRQLTNQQFKRLNFFGNIREMQLEEGKHPFESWIRQVTNKYEGFGFLKNKEVLGVMLQGWSEGWGSDEIDRQVKLTDWFQNHQSARLDWANLGKADQKIAIDRMGLRVTESLESLYGSNWQQYVSKNEALAMADKIASGRLGDPDGGFTDWFGRQQNKAENIDGTPAQLGKAGEDRDLANDIGNPENMYQTILEQEREWLGPTGAHDTETLKKWAGRLANGTISQVDWEDHLRQRKSALFPFLDENETWQDAASTYRSIAEGQLGGTLNWDDQLFNNFMKLDAEGNPVGDGASRMSAFDFQKAVRSDPRFNSSKMASDKYSGLTSFMDNLFNATPYSNTGGF